MRSKQWTDIDMREATVVLHELEWQGGPSRRAFKRGSATARISISWSVKSKVQPSLKEQSVCMRSSTKFRNFAMEDNNAELTTILLQQLRDFNVSLMFGSDVADVGLFRKTPLSCDARRWSHGRAAGS